MGTIVVEIVLWDDDKADALIRKIGADGRVASVEVISS